MAVETSNSMFYVEGSFHCLKWPQVAFAVHESGLILIGESGHGKLIRGRDAHEFWGGWVFLTKNQMVWNSGNLMEVPDRYKEAVTNAISNWMKKDLR